MLTRATSSLSLIPNMSYSTKAPSGKTSRQNSYSDHHPTDLLPSLASASPTPKNESPRSRRRADTQNSDQITYSLNRTEDKASLAVPATRERTSRSRERDVQSRGSNRGVSPLPSADSDEICDACDITDPDLSYCNVCDTILCAECWPRQAPHRKKRLAPGSVRHEKTNIALAKKIQKVLVPTSNSTKLTQLHEEDEETAWFGQCYLTLVQMVLTF